VVVCITLLEHDMSSPSVAQLCVRLGDELEPGVREIGRRCLAAFTEFTGLRYARLTAADAERLSLAARQARALDEEERAALLEDGARMIHAELAAAVVRLAPAKVSPRRTGRGGGRAAGGNVRGPLEE
jgi:hypothetical protein